GSALARESTRDKVDPTRTKGAHLRPKAFATKVAPTGARERPCPWERACARKHSRQGRSHKGRGGHPWPKALTTKVAPTRQKEHTCARRHSRPRSLPQGRGSGPVGARLRANAGQAA